MRWSVSIILSVACLFTAGLVTGCIESCSEGCSIPEKPNILFITTDYMRGADLPIEAASPFLHAPALSRLCEEGAVFTRHNCVAPICMPSRATIVTGHYPHSHSLWDNRAIPTRQEGLPFLIDDLKKAGYKTAGIGKMHFHPVFDDYNYDLRITLEGKDRAYQDDDYERYLESKGSSREVIKAMSDSTVFPRSHSFFDWYLDEELHPDYFVGHKTVETIREGFLDGNQPWFMWVSFTGPHNPWNAPSRLTDYYLNLDGLPLGITTENELENKPIEYTRHRYGYGGDFLIIYDTLDEIQQASSRRGVRSGHYGMISLIDEQINQIFSELESRGQLSNTIVIFTSDHGSALFDNNMLHKGSSFPSQSIVPFVVWGPGMIKPGIRESFTSNVDLYPTIMDLAGVEQPGRNEGRSFASMLLDDKTEIQDFTIIESTMVTSIMTRQWLFGIHHISGENELYNLKEDPICLFNLAGDVKYEHLIQDLEQDIVDWRKSLYSASDIGGDPYFWFEELGDTAEIQNYFRGYIDEYRRLEGFGKQRPGITGDDAAEILNSIETRWTKKY